MRKLLPLAALLTAGACSTKTTEIPVPAPAPISAAPVATPRAAVEAFLASVRAQDIQKFSEAWGDKNGPARDSKTMSHQDMEQRAIILLKCFNYDRYRLLGEAPATDGERAFQVELTRGTMTKVTDFLTVKGPDRWYVRWANIEPVKEMCPTR